MATRPAKPVPPGRKSNGGAHSKLTPALQQRVVELLGLGMGRMRVARAAGIHPASFFRWLEEGEACQAGIKREFFEAVRAAEEGHHEALLEEAKKLAFSAESESVRASMIRFKLERRYADDWGPRQEVRNTGPDGGPIQVQAAVTVQPLFSDEALAAMTPEQLAASIAALAGHGGKE